MRTSSHDLFIDAHFHEYYREHPLVLVDVGARGGLKSNWTAARPYLHVFGFEPDRREYLRLTAAGAGVADPAVTYFDIALHNASGPIRLHVARDRGLSSIFQPNREFLDAFPEANRFDIVEVVQVDADTLDNVLRSRQVRDVDFIKVDTQGSELFVLQGAAERLSTAVIGVEAEVEFASLYRDQPLFADVDRFMRELGFLLFDLRPCYWRRSAGRGVGGPKGQMVWADALYLKEAGALRTIFEACELETRKSKLLKAMSIAAFYGYFDYALEILRRCNDLLAPEEQTLVERRLREAGGLVPSRPIPGRRQLAAVLHRLWRLVQPFDDSWSISSSRLGNSG